MDNSDSAGEEGRPRVDHPDVSPFGQLGWNWRVFTDPDNEFRQDLHIAPNSAAAGNQARIGGVGNYEQNTNPSEEVDSHGKFKTEEVPHDNRGKYKTQLCYHWESHGYCLRGGHCAFAHGEQELRPVTHHAHYKTKLCHNVLAGGSCKYGHQCHFRHASDNI